MTTIRSKVPTKEFKDGWDRIFGERKRNEDLPKRIIHSSETAPADEGQAVGDGPRGGIDVAGRGS